MDLVKSILVFIQKPESETKNTSPNGLCPVCWGYGEYDGKLRNYLKDRQIDVNNKKSKYMLVEQFVKEHLEGFRIKEASVSSCPTCNPSLS